LQANPNSSAPIKETEMTDEFTPSTDTTKDQLRYTSPAIVYELKLETRAGSPLGVDPIFDPLGIDPSTK
jgi:hypothetical protein